MMRGVYIEHIRIVTRILKSFVDVIYNFFLTISVKISSFTSFNGLTVSTPLIAITKPLSTLNSQLTFFGFFEFLFFYTSMEIFLQCYVIYLKATSEYLSYTLKDISTLALLNKKSTEYLQG